ncbi:UNVERIFIED_CONTAM: hypothetical protein Slati_0293100 [Sesamum latifolium]|uniref:Uncharacterized protein n=1 Tax=Sesamum latifolium TaxID=2727402 RepID=A0AAW2YEN5_9LAMI
MPPPKGLDKLLAPKATPFSRLPKLKKLSWGNGPDRVFILFNPKDDATIGETDSEVGPAEGGPAGGGGASSDFFNLEGEVEIPGVGLLDLSVSLPLEESFFFSRLLAALVGVPAEAAGAVLRNGG